MKSRDELRFGTRTDPLPLRTSKPRRTPMRKAREEIDLTVVGLSRTTSEQCWRSVVGSGRYHALLMDINKRSESKANQEHCGFLSFRSRPNGRKKAEQTIEGEITPLVVTGFLSSTMSDRTPGECLFLSLSLSLSLSLVCTRGKRSCRSASDESRQVKRDIR